MRKQIVALMSAVLIGLTLATAPGVAAMARGDIGLDIPAGAYGYSVCPKALYCQVDVRAVDMSVWYEMKVIIYRNNAYAEMHGAVCTAHEVGWCFPVSSVHCSTAGCRVWGEAQLDLHSGGFVEYVDIYNYDNGRIIVQVKGTTSGWIKVRGVTVKTW